MKVIELKVARIGNSRGVRLPAAALKRYGIDSAVLMEERSDGILLRPPGRVAAKLSWEDTALAMVASDEDWNAWDATAADGQGAVPWERPVAPAVAEPKTRYRRGKRIGKRA